MKAETKQDVEWVVAEDHPQLFECGYINEPHEEREEVELTPYPEPLNRSDEFDAEVTGWNELKLSTYLQRNAEANATARFYRTLRDGCLPSTAQCTPSRDLVRTMGESELFTMGETRRVPQRPDGTYEINLYEGVIE